MDAKLGHHRTWQMPVIHETVGPYHPSAFSAYDTMRRRLVLECENKLATYTADQIAILIGQRRGEQGELVSEWKEFLSDEIATLQKGKPPWFAGGFGHPDFKADFEYWGQMEAYTLHEALLLSVGVEPKHIGEEVLKKAKKDSEQVRLLPQMQYLARRHEQFFRKFPSMGYGPMSVSSAFLTEWFDEVGLAVHPEFSKSLNKRSSAHQNSSNLKDQAEQSHALSRPDQREIDKIAQLFTAMAIDSLGYDPNALRSPTPKEIADLAAGMGLSVSDDTVRKYLKLGARFLPEDWKPD